MISETLSFNIVPFSLANASNIKISPTSFEVSHAVLELDALLVWSNIIISIF